VGQTIYASIKSPPFLRKLPGRRLQIVGAARQEPVSQVSAAGRAEAVGSPAGVPE